MKLIIPLITLLALVTSGFSQSREQIDNSVRIVSGTNPWVGIPQASNATRSILDGSGRVIVYGSPTSPLELVFPGANTNDGFNLTLRVTEPTAARVLTLPNATGSLAF